MLPTLAKVNPRELPQLFARCRRRVVMGLAVSGVLALALPAHAGPGEMSLFAGTGQFGFNGDGVEATAAQIGFVSRLTVDLDGNIVFGDDGRLRRINRESGIVVTIAGDGTCGSAGDGGLATDAQVCTPSEAVHDSSGNVYFTDSSTRRVRRIDALTGVITTVAGNGDVEPYGEGQPAASVGFLYPQGLEIDPAGNLYVADRHCGAVRRIDRESGLIATVAGTAGMAGASLESSCGFEGFAGDGGPAHLARLAEPSDVMLDGTGGLLISDRNNHRIRRVDLATGIIDTVAGSGSATFNGNTLPALETALQSPEQLARDADGGVYVADWLGGRILRISPLNGRVVTVAGGGTSSSESVLAVRRALNRPEGIAVTAEGDLIIADSLNFRIVRVENHRRAVNTAGWISTAAGIGLRPFEGSATAGSDDFEDARYAYLSDIFGLTVSDDGNLLFVDADRVQVRRADRETHLITNVAGMRWGDGSDDDGVLAIEARLRDPTDVAVASNGDVLVTEPGAYRVRRIEHATGRIHTVAGGSMSGVSGGDGGLARDAELARPVSVEVDGEDNVYLIDDARIRRIDGETAVITTVAGTGVHGYSGDGAQATLAEISPSSISVRGDVLIVSDAFSRIRRVDLRTGLIDTIAGTGSCGSSGDGGPATAAEICPAGVVLDSQGEVTFAEPDFRVVRRIDPEGMISTVAGMNDVESSRGDGGPASLARFDLPYDVAVDALDNLFISDGARIRRVGSSRAVAECELGDTTNPCDADGDGIVDDGDESGVSGDRLCHGNVSSGCDDNCVLRPNENQQDSDDDSIGDVCDLCPGFPDPDQSDRDADGVSDACDACANTTASVVDAEGCGCDEKSCSDGLSCNGSEGCEDSSAECHQPAALPTACDRDGDGVADVVDRCPYAHDPRQRDRDRDGVGDACDNCVKVANGSQQDIDGDQVGDACEPQNAPHIDRLVPSRIPSAGVVMIVGRNFGVQPGKALVVAGSTPATIVSWRDSRIKVALPALAKGSHAVFVKTPESSNEATLSVTDPSGRREQLENRLKKWQRIIEARLKLNPPTEIGFTFGAQLTLSLDEFYRLYSLGTKRTEVAFEALRLAKRLAALNKLDAAYDMLGQAIRFEQEAGQLQLAAIDYVNGRLSGVSTYLAAFKWGLDAAVECAFTVTAGRPDLAIAYDMVDLLAQSGVEAILDSEPTILKDTVGGVTKAAIAVLVNEGLEEVSKMAGVGLVGAVLKETPKQVLVNRMRSSMVACIPDFVTEGLEPTIVELSDWAVDWASDRGADFLTRDAIEEMPVSR